MSFFKNRKFTRIAFWIIVFVAMFAAEYAFARAGGGGGFGRGGGGFSGGGGGSGGDSGLIYLLIYFAIKYPVVGVPVLIIVVTAIILGGKKGHSAHVSRTIRRAYSNQDVNALSQNEALLVQRDPNFSKENLAGRVRAGFAKIQTAWANQDMKPVRHIISDGIFERFSLQLEMQKSSLIKNKIENLNVADVRAVAIESDKFFVAVHLRISASASDYFVDLEKGRKVYGSGEEEFFVEYWSLLRRPGVKTLEKPGLFEGFCPNCGNPIETADCTECPSCKALINSGEYDWVLTEITQESEWQFRPSRNIPGIEELTQKDPAFNVQHVEDRASVIFYRNIAAQFFADKKYLAKLACGDFMKSHKTDFRTQDNGKHKFMADAAVGSVELVEVKLADDSEGMDKARVKIKWSGHCEEAEVPSLIRPDFEASHIYTNEFILIRKSSVQSSAKNVLTSVHCPNCGAPETRSEKEYCEYCHTPLNDGSRDWTLSEVGRFSGYPQVVHQYKAMQAETPLFVGGPMLSSVDNETIIACCAGVMLADGEIDPQEKELLESMSKAKGVSPEKLNMLIGSVQAGTMEIPVPESSETAKELLRCMVMMCLMDGKVTSSERDLLKTLASRMGYTDIDIQQMIKRERMELFKKAKQA
jgi:tellurite resistance protein